MKKAIASLLVVSSLALVGCDDVSQTQSLSFADIKATTASMSSEEKEDYIYDYITDRLTVDLNRLSKASAEDEAAINDLLVKIQGDLTGQRSNTIGLGVSNYLLHEFARTPYGWSVNGVNILGYDPATRYYFVDVNYKTNSAAKTNIPLNTIVMGEPNEEGRKKERYEDYTNYLNAKYASRSGTGELLAKFSSKWGDVATVVASQEDKMLTDRVTTGVLGSVGYAGMTNTSIKSGASMTVRYVLSYTYNVGQVTGLAVEHVYLTDYAVDNATELEQSLRGNIEGTEVINPIVKEVITSYHRSVESNNLQGLYGLFNDFKQWDKYYNDMNSYSYHTYLGFDYEIINNNNGNIDVLVTRGRKTRAKGSNMSSPVYTEKVLFRMKVANNDTIKIVEEIILNRNIIGEPNSVIKDVTGVSDKMLFSEAAFTSENQAAIEQLIKDFNDSHVQSTTNDMKYMSYVDVAINQNTLNNMVTVLNTFNDVQGKLVWITGYETKSNVYCSLKVREVYLTGNGNYDTEAVIDFAYNDGSWGIIGYNREMSVKLSDGVNIDETGVFHKSTK